MKIFQFLSYFFKLILVCMPWFLKRYFLQSIFGYKLERSARIGFAWVFPRNLLMSSGSTIGSFTVIVHLEFVMLEKNTSIGRNNWITGFPMRTKSSHFTHQPDRIPSLILGEHSAITKNHHIDCTNVVKIGCFTTIAGYNSQILTHSIDIIHNRQQSLPVTIGSYCFIGTNCVILPGSSLPDYCVLGASSLLNKVFPKEFTLYAGSPAREVKALDPSATYFKRNIGYVI